ncbi:hypothetical protein OsJ_15066 [Oryza sativa Japonica Group]|uniref:Formin-like protein n=1 Tax=Oryza sativa subsp. japonica TaxID=39947 RepID=B9FFJ8_ORYSJ|nr:hypothetical protein OsJ_15066 [Oryza sativa Japonica Group]
MVWDRIRSSSFELDEKMIESLFGYNARCSTKHEEVQSRSPSLGHHVLDTKRLQNFTILMKAVSATAEQIFAALLHGNGLSAQQLEALIKMAPAKDEADKLSAYDGDVDGLVPAERLLKVVLTIPCAFARVEAMLYRETFADEVGHIRKSFEMLEEACRELMSSKLFLKLLEAVLKTGNRMNVGTARGGAMAFKLDALLKLADVKGTDGKTTLLHFVVQEMTRSRAAEAADIAAGLGAELTNVRKTATVDLDVLTTSVSGLSHGLSRIKELVGSDLSGDERNQCFVAFMAPFVAHAGEVIRELEDGERRVLAHVREITEYYHGDVGKDEASPLRIFVIVRDFLGMLERVCKEVRGAKNCHGGNPALNLNNQSEPAIDTATGMGTVPAITTIVDGILRIPTESPSAVAAAARGDEPTPKRRSKLQPTRAATDDPVEALAMAHPPRSTTPLLLPPSSKPTAVARSQYPAGLAPASSATAPTAAGGSTIPFIAMPAASDGGKQVMSPVTVWMLPPGGAGVVNQPMQYLAFQPNRD